MKLALALLLLALLSGCVTQSAIDFKQAACQSPPDLEACREYKDLLLIDGTFSQCFGIPFTAVKDECLHGFALKELDFQTCLEIETASLKDACLSETALELDSSEPCRSVSAPLVQNECYASLGEINPFADCPEDEQGAFERQCADACLDACQAENYTQAYTSFDEDDFHCLCECRRSSNGDFVSKMLDLPHVKPSPLIRQLCLE